MANDSIIKCRIILLCVGLLLVIPGISQVTVKNVTGYIYDSAGLAPMPNVNVVLSGDGRSVTSNRSGYFKMAFRGKSNKLLFSYMGYVAKEITVTDTTKMPLRVYLALEIKNIGEVRIVNERFRNILEGDSLRVLDYEIRNNRLLILAQSANDSLKQRIYLTSLGGYIYSYRNLKDVGKEIKFPDEPGKRQVYLFKDSYGEVQLLARTRVWQIFIKDDHIYLLYPNKYETCTKNLFPIKCRLNNKLFFQEADDKSNATYFLVRDSDTIKRVKLITDEYNKVRYLRQRAVKVPLLVYNQQLVLFNFYRNEIEFFNEQARSVKKVPTLFHTRWYYDQMGKKAYDLDAINFTQQIIHDQVTNRVYSVWKTVLTGRYTLKELDINNGILLREIPISDHPFIDKILINDNRVYFMFRDRAEQKFKSLYTMTI
ncbi:MAG: carboxypeptidase-like regulatory domain-containing protein [Bacteroidales bacterium]|nr:carboxypeptidase-like regulatory domain-containing protein [Bacteroidales bacterium]